MKVYAVTMIKDEVDVIAYTLRHLASERVDGIVVADNLSSDGTWEAINDLRGELAAKYPELEFVVTRDLEPAYYQSQKMTGLAAMAAHRGAQWIVPFDADELWFAPERPLGDELRRMAPSTAVNEAQLWNHVATGVDPPGEPNPFLRIGHRLRDPGVLPKVALRWEPGAVIQAGNHGVMLPRGGYRQNGLRVAHFPYRSFSQFLNKVRNGSRAYALTDLPLDTGAHWRQYGFLLETKGEDALRRVFDDWFYFQSPEALQFLPAPYCRWA